jgi:hypothetical protein
VIAARFVIDTMRDAPLPAIRINADKKIAMFWHLDVAIGRRNNARLPAITRPLILRQINGQYECVSVLAHLCNDAFADRYGLAHRKYSSL